MGRCSWGQGQMREGTTRARRDLLHIWAVFGPGHGDRIGVRVWNANVPLWSFSLSHVGWDPGRPGELAGGRVSYQRHEGASPGGTK